MLATTQLGIWMDHSEAHLITNNQEPSAIGIINNPFTQTEEVNALRKSEHLMHNKRQQQEAAYYKKLGDKIIKYNDVLLFGPTDAKLELINALQADQRFSKVKINVQPTDQMTNNEKKAFVKNHFSPKNK